MVSQVIGEVDRCHSAGTQLALDLIAVGENFAKAIRGLGHAGHNVAWSRAGRQQNISATGWGLLPVHLRDESSESG